MRFQHNHFLVQTDGEAIISPSMEERSITLWVYPSQSLPSPFSQMKLTRVNWFEMKLTRVKKFDTDTAGQFHLYFAYLLLKK